jgi:photosystem II stability/assembly factor-like uncharacterized protein
MNCKMTVRALLVAIVCSTVSWASGPGTKPWAAFGPDGGDARRIASDPRDHAHLYLGSANGWIYESHNGGAIWNRLAQVGKRDDLVLDSIIVDPQNSGHIVVGAWVIDRPDGGLYFTWDGGATWTNQAEMRGEAVLSLAMSASDPRIMVAGTQKGIFRSSDGGQRWSRISPEDNTEIHNVQSVAIDPQDPNIIYAGTWHLPWKTVDGGDHWESIKKGIIEDSDVFSIIVDPGNPATVFASACSGIYKSENAGLLFRKVPGIPPSARRTRRLLQDPSNLDIVYAGTTEGLYRSIDGGKTFILTTSPEFVVNDVAIDSADPKHVLIATDRGGVLASEDGADTFHPSNRGFSARQVTAIKRDAKRPETLFVGVVNDRDWGGVFQSDNDGQNWIQRSDGLGGRDVFSLGQAPDGTMIAGTAHGLFRLDPLTLAWNRVESAPGTPTPQESVQAILTRAPVPVNPDSATPPTAPDAAFPDTPVTPTPDQTPAKHPKLTKAQLAAQRRAAAAKAAPPKVAAATHKAVAAKHPPVAPTVARSFDGSVYALATAGQTILAATSVGLLTSVDNGLSWAATGPPDSSEWRFIAGAGKNVVAASLHSAQFSSDSGILWEPVTLPEDLTQVYALAVDKSGEIWVGGHQGVFVSSNRGKSWSIPKNLYLNAVNNIFYDDSSDSVVITTGGESSIVFTVQLPSKHVTFTDTGWSLRFARPLGDHIIAATLFDGIVVQPRMVATPLAPLAPATAAISSTPTANSKQN